MSVTSDEDSPLPQPYDGSAESEDNQCFTQLVKDGDSVEQANSEAPSMVTETLSVTAIPPANAQFRHNGRRVANLNLWVGNSFFNIPTRRKRFP